MVPGGTDVRRRPTETKMSAIGLVETKTSADLSRLLFDSRPGWRNLVRQIRVSKPTQGLGATVAISSANVRASSSDRAGERAGGNVRRGRRIHVRLGKRRVVPVG